MVSERVVLWVKRSLVGVITGAWWLVVGLVISCTTTPGDGLILSPRDGETVRGVVVISVSPPADVVVDRVEFRIKGDLVGVVNAPGPYTYEWDTTTVSNGFYTISVSVYDIDGKTQSETIEVQVAN